VRGPVDVTDLGPTLMREHIFVLQPEALHGRRPNFAGEKPDCLHIWRAVLPALLEAGVMQEQIDEMTTASARRHFEPQR